MVRFRLKQFTATIARYYHLDRVYRRSQYAPPANRSTRWILRFGFLREYVYILHNTRLANRRYKTSNNRAADRPCPKCRIELLTGEKPGFCCGRDGNRFSAVQRLPQLPPEFDVFLRSPDISKLSRKLNLIFSFALMESSHAFPAPRNPSSVAVAGRVFHRIRSGSTDNSAVRWMLYNGFEDSSIPSPTHARKVPKSWVRAVRRFLSEHNPFASKVLSLRNLQVQQPHEFGSTSIVVKDSGCAGIAAVMCLGITVRSEVTSRTLCISTTDNQEQSIPTVSKLWEPTVYPLFFPMEPSDGQLDLQPETEIHSRFHPTLAAQTPMMPLRKYGIIEHA